MTINLDPTNGVNLVLCIVVLVLGYLIYRKKETISALLIGIAFGMFGFSHLSDILGLTILSEFTFVLLRLCGYILVAAALWLIFSG